MPELSQISAKQLVKTLQKVGFNFVSQKGSHIKLRKFGKTVKTVIVPNHKIIRPGTLNNVFKMAEISKSELKELLKK